MAFITLTVSNKVVETRFFPNQHLLLEGYIQGLKLDMLEQNEDILKDIPEKPAFEVEVTPKKIIRH